MLFCHYDHWPPDALYCSRFSFDDASFLVVLPCGLKLASRLFLDLESDLEVPRITLEIFCIVRSPMDSVRVNLGELFSLFFSSLNELDFLTLDGDDDGPDDAPNAS